MSPNASKHNTTESHFKVSCELIDKLLTKEACVMESIVGPVLTSTKSKGVFFGSSHNPIGGKNYSLEDDNAVSASLHLNILPCATPEGRKLVTETANIILEDIDSENKSTATIVNWLDAKDHKKVVTSFTGNNTHPFFVNLKLSNDEAADSSDESIVRITLGLEVEVSPHEINTYAAS